jgi:hypothetical protein
MNRYPCNLLNLDFAYFKNVTDAFIGQKVVIKCEDRDIVGRVFSAGIDLTEVQLFGDVSGFMLEKSTGIFEDNFIEIPLSPSILGRRLDIYGNALDGKAPVIPVVRSKLFYTPSSIKISKDQIVGEDSWLINTEGFKIQKGQVKPCQDFKKLLSDMNMANLVLVIAGVDSFGNIYDQLITDLGVNELDKVSVIIESQSYKDIELLPFTIYQVANYLADELSFDVVVAVLDSDLMPSKNQSNFYFVNSFEQIASNNGRGSVTVINC